MRLSEQRRKATKRDERIRDYARHNPHDTLDEIGRVFKCSRETARKALKDVKR
jgi:DNA-binding GntR family transcriptional regulator